MHQDTREFDARHAAVLQVLADQLRELIDAQGEAGTALAAWPGMLERVAAEILVGLRPADTVAGLPDLDPGRGQGALH